MGNEAHWGYGIQGYMGHMGNRGTGGMGHISNRSHGQWSTWAMCTVPFTVQPFAYTSCTSRLRAPQGSHRMGDQWHQL